MIEEKSDQANNWHYKTKQAKVARLIKVAELALLPYVTTSSSKVTTEDEINLNSDVQSLGRKGDVVMLQKVQETSLPKKLAQVATANN